MQINRTSILREQQINSSRTASSLDSSFSDIFSKKMLKKKDEYIPSELSPCAYVTYDRQENVSEEIKKTETNDYTISGRDGGYLRIENKETKEGFMWKLGENRIQVDSETGQKFLINDLGGGFFNMVSVDSALENAIKESLGVDELEEKELENFTVHKDGNTGIYYVTANGYESQGGQIILDNNAKLKLNSLADKYMEQYPQLMKSKHEAWFYATFEVRGLAKRTDEGIMMISPNSISFKDKNAEYDWTSVFDTKQWEDIKNLFDRELHNKDFSNKAFWENIFTKFGINVSFVNPDM